MSKQNKRKGRLGKKARQFRASEPTEPLQRWNAKMGRWERINAMLPADPYLGVMSYCTFWGEK